MLKGHVVLEKTDGQKCSFAVTGVENYSGWDSVSCRILFKNGSSYFVKGTFDEVTKKLESAE